MSPMRYSVVAPDRRQLQTIASCRSRGCGNHGDSVCIELVRLELTVSELAGTCFCRVDCDDHPAYTSRELGDRD